MLSSCWNSLFKLVGGKGRQIRSFIRREVMTNVYGHEVANTTLPGKATKLQLD